jgi:hypothetical protein
MRGSEEPGVSRMFALDARCVVSSVQNIGKGRTATGWLEDTQHIGPRAHVKLSI